MFIKIQSLLGKPLEFVGQREKPMRVVDLRLPLTLALLILTPLTTLASWENAKTQMKVFTRYPSNNQTLLVLLGRLLLL